MQATIDLSAIRLSLGSPGMFAELAILAAAFALAWFVARSLRTKLPGGLAPGIAKIGAGSAHRLVLPLALLILSWLGRFALSKFQATPILNVVIPLVLAFGTIRIAVYLLRHMLAPSALLKAAERFIVLGAWLAFVLYFTGVLGEIGAALDDVSFTLNKQKLTLRTVLEALFLAALTVFIAIGLSRLVEKRVMQATHLDMSSKVVIGKIVRALTLVLAVLIVLPIVGIDLTLLSVFGGALGVGLGFGLQKIASNYVSGFIILLDRSIRLGDMITVDNRAGVVENIRARYTVIRATDGTEAIVPNDTLITNTVINHSYTDRRVAVKLVVTVAYDADVDGACRLMTEIATRQPRVLAEPAPGAVVKALNDNGVEIELAVWIADPEHGPGPLKSDIYREILTAFRAHGIDIPFPRRDVRLLRR